MFLVYECFDALTSGFRTLIREHGFGSVFYFFFFGSVCISFLLFVSLYIHVWRFIDNLIYSAMDIHNLKTVACYNSRLLLRSWMFRLFLLLLFLIVILYQVLAQTNIFMG